VTSTVSYRVLWHATNLWHGANGFTSLLKEGMLRIFSPEKIQQLWLGANPRSWVPEASMLTIRLPKLLQLLVGQILLVLEVSRSHLDTSQSAGLLCKSDQPNAQNSDNIQCSRDRHLCPRWNSKPQSQQVSGSRSTPLTARPLGTASSIYRIIKWDMLNKIFLQ
jgi:hypothetical protein